MHSLAEALLQSCHGTGYLDIHFSRQGICLEICFYTGNSLQNTGNILKFQNLNFVVNFESANWEME